jgi:hypothetical protein
LSFLRPDPSRRPFLAFDQAASFHDAREPFANMDDPRHRVNDDAVNVVNDHPPVVIQHEATQVSEAAGNVAQWCPPSQHDKRSAFTLLDRPQQIHDFYLPCGAPM